MACLGHLYLIICVGLLPYVTLCVLADISAHVTEI